MLSRRIMAFIAFLASSLSLAAVETLTFLEYFLLLTFPSSGSSYFIRYCLVVVVIIWFPYSLVCVRSRNVTISFFLRTGYSESRVQSTRWRDENTAGLCSIAENCQKDKRMVSIRWGLGEDVNGLLSTTESPLQRVSRPISIIVP